MRCTMEIDRLEIKALVEIHCVSFQGFFLTSLGNRFLKYLYTAYLEDKDSILLVVKDEDPKIIGFIAGTISPSKFYRKILFQKSIKFLSAIIWQMFINPLLSVVLFKKVSSRIGFSSSEELSGAELSSIAVLPGYQGQNIGKILIENFEYEMKKKGVDKIYLTTDRDCNEKVNKFYEKCGWSLEKCIESPGHRFMNVYIKYL